MAFFISVPVRPSGMFGGDAAGDDGDSAALFHPFDELVAVIAFILKKHFASQVNGLQQFLRHADIIAVSASEQKAQRVAKPIRHHVELRRQTSPAASRFLIRAPFLAPPPCWRAFTVALSNIIVVSSTRSCASRA